MDDRVLIRKLVVKCLNQTAALTYEAIDDSSFKINARMVEWGRMYRVKDLEIGCRVEE